MAIVIVAGPRPPLELRGKKNLERLERWYAAHYHRIDAAVSASGFRVTRLVSGMAQGFDTLGARWADKNWIDVDPFQVSHQEWLRLGRRAGILRNIEMGDYAEALIALVADPPTPGTSHMVSYMRSLSKPVYEHPIK